MTLTVEISPETHQRIAADPEALRHVAKMIEDAYREPEPVKISTDLYDSLMERLDRIESGELKETPWDSEARKKRTAELLKREFGYESEASTEKAAV